MFEKSVYLLAFLISIALVAVTECDYVPEDQMYAVGSETIVGQRVEKDRLALSDSIVNGSRWLQTITENRLYIVDVGLEITMVRLVDRSPDGCGTTATILGGGPGWATCRVAFTSQRSCGIDHTIEIYAKQFP